MNEVPLYPCRVDMEVEVGVMLPHDKLRALFMYRGTSLPRNSAHLGTYSRTMSRVLWWP